MLVSVIVPNYNHEKYLDARIQSILNQTYRDFEIIILDDCSTDNSRCVIEKYRINKHVSCIVYNDVNSGSTFKQWEKGFSLSKGEIIWIAESDDMCDKFFLEKITRFFSDERVVMSFSRSLQIDGNGDVWGIYPTQINMNEDFCLPGVDFLKCYLSERNIVVNASSVLIRKNVIKDIPHDYYEYKGCGDWLFWIHIAEQGFVCYDASLLNFFRHHFKNTTNKLHILGSNAIEVCKIYKYLSYHGYLKGWKVVLFRTRRLHDYFFECPFENRSILDRVMKEWKLSFVDYILIYCLHFYRYLRY